MKSDQRIAIVTGGSRGIGRNVAVSLARKGVDVVLTYHSNRAEADAAVEEIRALGANGAALQLDTGKVASFDAFVGELKQALDATWGRSSFDYLVNNAGIGRTSLIAETSEDLFDLMMNVHLKGVYFLTQKLLPVIADGGRIINVTSGLTRTADPGYSVYATMKGGVEVFTRYLANELGPRRITVNTVSPGPILTDFGDGKLADHADMFAGLTALGRMGVPDDVGPMIASLLSDDNRWVNAQRIEVTGGMNI